MTKQWGRRTGRNLLGRGSRFAVVLVLGLSIGLLPPPSSASHIGWGWGPAVLLADDHSANYSVSALVPQLAPQVVAYGQGNAIAVWSQGDGTRYSIWANRHSHGAGWGTASRVAMISGDDFNPRIDVDAHGNAIVLWEHRGVQDTLWASRYTVDAGWGTPTPIEGADNASDAQVAVDSFGNAIAVWREWEGADEVMGASRYMIGVGWSNAVEVGTIEGGASSPKIAVDGAGNAVVVWNGDAGVWANRYDVRTGWESPVVIGPVGTSIHTTIDPQVDMNAAGDTIVVWSAAVAEADGSFSGKGYANRFVPGSGWEGVTLVADNRSGEPVYDRSRGYATQVAMDSRGNAFTVWAEWNLGGLWGPSGVSASRYIVGLGWQTPVRLFGGDPVSVGYPQIAVDPHGSAVAVWISTSGAGFGVWAKRYVIGEGWRDASYVPESDDVRQWTESSKVAVDSAGNAYVVWQQEGDHLAVWANQFTQHGIPSVSDVALQELAFVRSIAIAALAGLLASVAVLVLLFRMTWKRWPSSVLRSPDELNSTGLSVTSSQDVAPLAENAPAALAPRQNAEKRWPTRHAATNGVRLIAKERILLHLLHFARYAEATEVPPELTQERIVEATGINRRHFAQYVRPLIQDGLVRERNVHVRGILQRRRVYVLTEEGRLKAMEIRDRIRSVVVRIRDASSERHVTIAEALLEARGSMSILDILRESIETGIVDLRH